MKEQDIKKLKQLCIQTEKAGISSRDIYECLIRKLGEKESTAVYDLEVQLENWIEEERKNNRKVLIELKFQFEYNTAYELVKSFQDSYPETKISFSANAGEAGAFITDHRPTYLLWLEWRKSK